MPLAVPSDAPTIVIRRSAFERAGLTRVALDTQLNLTPDEFRVDSELVAVGPLWGDDVSTALIEALEAAGLAYFDDFFELSGNWPIWLRVLVLGGPAGETK